MKVSRTGRRGGLLTTWILGVALSSGCGGGSTLPSSSSAEQARPILTNALDAWKRGEKPDTLATSQPPVRVIDHQWQTGWSLVNYEFKGEGQSHGVNIQQSVAMELKDPKGKAVKRTGTFLVNTGAEPVITRGDLDGD